MSHVIAKVAAALQIVIGLMLLAGTIGLTLTAYKTIRTEAVRLSDNLSATVDALESMKITYGQSATNLFGLTGAMDDVSWKLTDVSDSALAIGKWFLEYGEVEDPSFWDKLRPFKEFSKNSGQKLTDVGKDVKAVAIALKGQSEAIKDYRDNGHNKSLILMTKSVESLQHAIRMLDSGRSTGLWCGFVCVLGFCVSMLFILNGVLLFVYCVVGLQQGRAPVAQ